MIRFKAGDLNIFADCDRFLVLTLPKLRQFSHQFCKNLTTGGGPNWGPDPPLLELLSPLVPTLMVTNTMFIAFVVSTMSSIFLKIVYSTCHNSAFSLK